MKQNLAKPVIWFLLLFVWHFMSSGAQVDTQKVTFRITNKCPFPIWPATAPNAGHSVIAEGGFFLHSDRGKRVQAPSNWSGRIWARTGCNFTCPTSFTENDFNCVSEPVCQTGDCGGLLSCNGTIGLPPVTLIEVTVQPNTSGPIFYDVSLVDGYNLPVSVSTRPLDPECSIKSCAKSVNTVCPEELRVLDQSGAVVACKSACLALDDDAYCCRNEYGNPESCVASSYSKVFKDACPSYFSYAFDTPTPLKKCNSRDYVITFCPKKWGSALQSI